MLVNAKGNNFSCYFLSKGRWYQTEWQVLSKKVWRLLIWTQDLSVIGRHYKSRPNYGFPKAVQLSNKWLKSKRFWSQTPDVVWNLIFCCCRCYCCCRQRYHCQHLAEKIQQYWFWSLFILLFLSSLASISPCAYF